MAEATRWAPNDLELARARAALVPISVNEAAIHLADQLRAWSHEDRHNALVRRYQLDLEDWTAVREMHRLAKERLRKAMPSASASDRTTLAVADVMLECARLVEQTRADTKAVSKQLDDRFGHLSEEELETLDERDPKLAAEHSVAHEASWLIWDRFWQATRMEGAAFALFCVTDDLPDWPAQVRQLFSKRKHNLTTPPIYALTGFGTKRCSVTLMIVRAMSLLGFTTAQMQALLSEAKGRVVDRAQVRELLRLGSAPNS